MKVVVTSNSGNCRLGSMTGIAVSSVFLSPALYIHLSFTHDGEVPCILLLSSLEQLWAVNMPFRRFSLVWFPSKLRFRKAHSANLNGHSMYSNRAFKFPHKVLGHEKTSTFSYIPTQQSIVPSVLCSAGCLGRT